MNRNLPLEGERAGHTPGGGSNRRAQTGDVSVLASGRKSEQYRVTELWYGQLQRCQKRQVATDSEGP